MELVQEVGLLAALLLVCLALLPLAVGVELLAVWLALLPLAPLAALEGLARPLELRFLVQVLVLCLDLDQLCAASGLHVHEIMPN